MSRPALSASSSGPASEICSLVSGDDFSDRLLVSTSSPLDQQDLVVQTQNGVNMALGTATSAPSTATTAPSTAPLPLTAGPSTIEPIVPIVAPLGAQDTPSVIQRARPVISTEQTMQSTPGYGTLPYVSGPQYTAPRRLRHPCCTLRIRHPCRLWHPCHMLPCLLCQQGLLSQWVIMLRAIGSPIGCLRESRCYNISSFRNCSSLKLGELAKPSLSPPLVHWGLQLRLGTMLRPCQGGQPVLKGLDLKTRPQTKLNVPGLLQRLVHPPLPRGTTLGGLAQPQGHLRPVLNGQSTGLLLPRTLKGMETIQKYEINFAQTFKIC